MVTSVKVPSPLFRSNELGWLPKPCVFQAPRKTKISDIAVVIIICLLDV